jgi:hypothetical protein
MSWPACAGLPHFRSVDGLAYDMQAAGEFVLAARADQPEGDRIQTRQEPLAAALCPHVTLNTAVAAKLGPARLAIYAGAPPKVLVDGSPVSLLVNEARSLGGGVVLARTAEDAWEATWGTGATLDVHADSWAHEYHLDVTVTPPASWRGKMRGLLGDFDGQPGNDLRLPDGTWLEEPLTWEGFYLGYADSLRVGDGDTLFDYEPGQGPASFRRAALPSLPSIPASLPAAARDSAASTCAATGVTDRTLLDACTMDVACSGGDASQASWIKGVEPPSATLTLAVGPVQSELWTTFAATRGSYADTDDLEAACRSEFGADAELADWLDVKGIPLDSLDAWRQAVGLTTYDANELYLKVGGQELWSAPRHYFIVWHDHQPASGFLVHDTIDSDLIDLGSWYGWSRRALCRVCAGGPCGSLVGSAPTSPRVSCSDIVAQQGARGDGRYWIDPSGASAPFAVDCDMTTVGGGWTLVTDRVAATLDGVSTKRYLYAADGKWYRSPPTTFAWSWSAGQELTGTYDYFDGTETGAYTCDGSGEKPPFGIGCSKGPGGTQKTLPWVGQFGAGGTLPPPDPANGSCGICQDQPGALGPALCLVASVFVRFE